MSDIVGRLREKRGILDNKWPGPSALEMEAAADIERLRKLLQFCRMRLKRDAYREYVDRCLADLSLLDADPEMQGKLVQSTDLGQGAKV